MVDEQTVKLAVRWLHVVAMAVMVGGGLLVTAVALHRGRSSRPHAHPPLLAAAAETYEWAFWGALAVGVMTGIGNLGAFGAGLPPPISGWGSQLIIKLGLVLALLVFSVERTLVVSRLLASSVTIVPPRVWRIVAGMYVATVLLTLGILAVAVGLAHG